MAAQTRVNAQVHTSTTEVTKKWVTNLSSTPLTEEQERLLAHGPKFSIRPRQPQSGNT